MRELERVARAIYEVDSHLNAGVPIPWEQLLGPLRECAMKQARAAIEAMREPPMAHEDHGAMKTDP